MAVESVIAPRSTAGEVERRPAVRADEAPHGGAPDRGRVDDEADPLAGVPWSQENAHRCEAAPSRGSPWLSRWPPASTSPALATCKNRECCDNTLMLL
jgi:hypothetical protein